MHMESLFLTIQRLKDLIPLYFKKYLDFLMIFLYNLSPSVKIN
jgi:hypothetical protein